MMIYHPPQRYYLASPVIVVWGVDPGSQDYTDRTAFELINGDADARLGDRLLAAGHGVIILMPNDTTTYLHANALWVVRTLEEI